tara:strand:- start:746 stop:1786 length:1041 start_codon:yes stop_codon:yes gene_type:complete
MIHYNFITFILFLIIFILILKFRNVHIDKFSGELVCNNNNSVDCKILNLLKNEKTNEFILRILKDKIKNDNSAFINELNEQVNDSQNTIDLINQNIDYIDENIRQLNDTTVENTRKYFEEKKKIYEKINKFFNPSDSNSTLYIDYKTKPDGEESDYHKKNKQLVKRLIDYHEKVMPLQKSIDKNENIFILKNKYSKIELNLIKRTNKQNIQVFNDDSVSNTELELYNLILNNGCVNFINKKNYKVDSCQNVCDPGGDNCYLYKIDKIGNKETYKKHIQYSNNHTDFNLVEVDNDQQNVEYPFYIISPLKQPGYCVTIENNKIFFKPVRYDKNQRFNFKNKSSFCIY